MKKIKLIELSSLIITITVTMTFGINIRLLITNTSMNSLLTLVLAYILGFIPLFLHLKIANYLPKLNIIEKINNKFFNLIICLSLLVVAITINYNINNFVTSQFLYKTPLLLISFIFLFMTTYCANKGIKTIARLNFLLNITNITLFIISFTSIFKQINIDNFLPILKENTHSIIPTAIKISLINTIPIITILIIPKNNIEDSYNYNKTIIISYLLGALISLLITFATIGTLGIYLSKAYEYPEYIVLKKVAILGSLERIENIVSNQWIISSFIYISLIIYYLSQNIKFPKSHLLIGITIYLLSNLIFQNNTEFFYFTNNIFPYICIIPLGIYLILLLTLSKRRNI